MPGGADIVVPGRATERQAEDALTCLRVHWPEAVVADHRYSPETSRVWREVFIHENEAAVEAWDKDGGVEQNMGTLIHVLFGETSTTFVVDRQGSFLYEFVRSIILAVWG
jgi:hypothetical protein